MKNILRPILLVTAISFVFSCGLSVFQGGGSSLTVSVDTGMARTIEPLDTEIQPASYSLRAEGPSGIVTLEPQAGGEFTLSGLAAGEWRVTIDVLNAQGLCFLRGSGKAVVKVLASTSLVLRCKPLEGNGNLSLRLSWPAAVNVSEIRASLNPVGGVEFPISFNLSGNQASFDSSSLPSGSYTLKLGIHDGTRNLMSVAHALRVYAGLTSSKAFDYQLSELQSTLPPDLDYLYDTQNVSEITIQVSVDEWNTFLGYFD